MPRGALIVIEGLDRAGKSTQCRLLAETLPNATCLRFPDRSTPIGTIIDAYLKAPPADTTTARGANTVLRTNHLLFSANRWEAVPKILRLLEDGTSIVLDRYIYSGIAYSYAAERVGKEGTDTGTSTDGSTDPITFPSWLYSPDIGLPAPDLTIFLSIDPATAQQRPGYGAERYENPRMQHWVRAAFDAMKHRCTEIKTDGLTIDEVAKAVLAEVEKLGQVDGEVGVVEW